MYGGGSRGLEGEPLLQACATESVEAVEQRERLVEEVGAYLRVGRVSWCASLFNKTRG